MRRDDRARDGGKPLPGLLQDQIEAKTDGVPLFIEELTRAVIESDIVVARVSATSCPGSSVERSRSPTPCTTR